MKIIAVLMMAMTIAGRCAMCAERMFPKHTAGKWTAQIETRGIPGHKLPYQEYRLFRQGPDDPALVEVLPWQPSHWFAGMHLREDGLLIVKDDHLGVRAFFPGRRTATGFSMPKLNFCLGKSPVERARTVMGDTWLLDDILLFSRYLDECQQIGYFRISSADESISAPQEIVEVTSHAAAIDPRIGVIRLGNNLAWVNKRAFVEKPPPEQWRAPAPQIFNIDENAVGDIGILTLDLLATHPVWFYDACLACRKNEDPIVAEWADAVWAEMKRNPDIVRAARRQKQLQLEQLEAE